MENGYNFAKVFLRRHWNEFYHFITISLSDLAAAMAKESNGINFVNMFVPTQSLFLSK